MKKRLLMLSLALPLIVPFAGCDNSETATAPNGGKKVDNSKDVAPPKIDPPANKVGKKGPEAGVIATPN
jgi:hypothetical protein